MAKAQRYDQILELVCEAKPASIIEIGVWNGARAVLMAEAALKHSPSVHYTGYDLFEEATAETNEVEFNAKHNCTIVQVVERLTRFGADHRGFTFALVKGNTRQTLADKNLIADFAYIDGGHSVETIRSDYQAVRGCPMVVFDDYYRPDPSGACANLEAVGANAIVDAVPGAEVLASTDPLKGGGTVCLAVVRNGV